MTLSPPLSLLFGFLLVVGGSALFTRAIEKTAERFFSNRGRGLRILANISLSLPELILPLIAFLAPGKGPEGDRVAAGTGALFGPPLFLLLFLLPLAPALGRPERRSLLKEIPVLLPAVAGTLLLFDHPLFQRFLLALLMAVLYLWGLLGATDVEAVSHEENPEPWGVRDALFITGGVALMAGGSEIFLSGITALRDSLGLSPFLSAIVLAPLATEAPELLTLFHFLRKKRFDSSFSILWGSIHLQITLSLAAGLIASPWQGSPRALTAGAVLLVFLAGLLLVVFLREISKRGLPSK